MKRLTVILIMLFALSGCESIRDLKEPVVISYQQVDFETKDIAFTRTFTSEPEIHAVNFHAILGIDNELVIYALEGRVYDNGQADIEVQFTDLSSSYILNDNEEILNLEMKQTEYENSINATLYMVTNQSRVLIFELKYTEDNKVSLNGNVFYTTYASQLDTGELIVGLEYDPLYYELIITTNTNHKYRIETSTRLWRYEKHDNYVKFLEREKEIKKSVHRINGNLAATISFDNLYTETWISDSSKPSSIRTLSFQLPLELEEDIIYIFKDEYIVTFISESGNVFSYYIEDELFFYINNIITPYKVEEFNEDEMYPVSGLLLSDILEINENDQLVECTTTNESQICISADKMYILSTGYVNSRFGEYFYYESINVNEFINVDLSKLIEYKYLSTFDYQVVFGSDYYAASCLNIVTNNGVYVLAFDQKEDRTIVFETKDNNN